MLYLFLKYIYYLTEPFITKFLLFYSYRIKKYEAKIILVQTKIKNFFANIHM